jgi:hypothetical protein
VPSSALSEVHQPIDGYIRYFGLGTWWLNELTENERTRIGKVYQSGNPEDTVTSDTLVSTSQHVVSFLGGLAGWFNNGENRALARKILDMASTLASEAPILDQHFFLQQLIEVSYKERQDLTRLKVAIAACRQQIALAPEAANAFKLRYRDRELPLPSHKGYEQLAIVLEKDGHYREVVELSQQAKFHGWAGDWDKRIERCNKKLTKA